MPGSDFKQAIESAMDGIALLDENGIYYYMNISHAVIFGYKTPEELIGKSWQELYFGDEIHRIINDIFPLLIQNGSWSGETLGKKKDGSSVFQEITLSLLKNKGLICICRDITQRKSNQLKLMQLAIAAEKSKNIVITTTPQKEILWVNESFQRLLKFSLQEVSGIDVDTFYYENTSSLALTEQLNFSKEIKFLTREKKLIWLLSNCTPIFDDQGNIASYLITQTDITFIKSTSEKLKQTINKERDLNKLKSQFINTVSHQLRTPLHSIQTSIDLLNLRANSESNSSSNLFIKKAKHDIGLAISDMTLLLEKILLSNELNHNKIIIKKQEESLRNFMFSFVDQFNENNSDPRNLNFSFNFKSITGDNLIFFDKIILSNILHNLLSNAFKYSINNPPPELIVTQENNNFSCVIKDYGIGIPSNDLKNINKSFFRGSNVSKIKGTGLGIPIARQLAKLHELEIVIKSKLGKGTQVILSSRII